jgi:chromosome segregation ATPase
MAKTKSTLLTSLYEWLNELKDREQHIKNELNVAKKELVDLKQKVPVNSTAITALYENIEFYEFELSQLDEKIKAIIHKGRSMEESGFK